MRGGGRTFSSNGMQKPSFLPSSSSSSLEGLSTLCLGLFALAREEDGGKIPDTAFRTRGFQLLVY